MNKEEYVKSFIDVLKNGEEEKIYKFFTHRTQVFVIKENKEISVEEFISFLKETLFNQSIEIKRFFESDVCVKIEIVSPKFNFEAFIIEILERRIKRIELF